MKLTNIQTGHDAPVWTREEDFYDRWPVATTISRIISTAPAEWSTRIGLFAPWGDGKTSALNFLEQQQKQIGNIVIRYTPWGASTPEEVWKDFGTALIQGLKKNGVSTAFWRRAAHWATSKKAPLQTTVKVAGTWADASGYVVGGAAGAEFASTVIGKKLTFTGKDIERLTAQLGARRVVVFIDDLDRTDEAVVPKLLLVLRELLDFAQFAFVLAFDQWDSPEITDTFLNAERARRVRNGKYPKEVWIRVQARSGQASNAARQCSCHGSAGPGRARERAAALDQGVRLRACRQSL